MNGVKPLFLLAGGGSQDKSATVRFFSHALMECGRQKPQIAYVGAANGDNAIFFGSIRTLLEEAGAGHIFLLPLAQESIDIASVKQALEQADVVFLSGGEVEDGMHWLKKHGLDSFLWELRGRGKLFLGVSAGSIMMGTYWVRWADPEDDGTAELFDCLGFVPTTFDTHAENEDWKELKTALHLQGSGSRGYGIRWAVWWWWISRVICPYRVGSFFAM